MTIDEAISFCDKKSKNIKLKAEPQTFIDIKEMLEELKCHRNDNDFSEYADRLYKKAYNKALEDFINAYYKYCENQYGRLADDEIVDMGKVKEKLVK